jgi:hypothetical protein
MKVQQLREVNDPIPLFNEDKVFKALKQIRLDEKIKPERSCNSIFYDFLS